MPVDDQLGISNDKSNGGSVVQLSLEGGLLTASRCDLVKSSVQFSELKISEKSDFVYYESESPNA